LNRREDEVNSKLFWPRLREMKGLFSHSFLTTTPRTVDWYMTSPLVTAQPERPAALASLLPASLPRCLPPLRRRAPSSPDLGLCRRRDNSKVRRIRLPPRAPAPDSRGLCSDLRIFFHCFLVISPPPAASPPVTTAKRNRRCRDGGS
jgi:hypothetical protein